jgi:RNA polymerase sigma-32 factor
MTQAIDAKAANYFTLVRRGPKLSRERERELALQWRENGDTSARDELAHSQLRNVVTIARLYRREACATFEELVAEGNFGLLQALAKFDPDRGTRLVTYAAYWIRSYISQYLIRSRSLVTTGVHSKLLAKLRRGRAREATAGGIPANADQELAEQLALSPDKLHSLVERLDVRDVSWDAGLDDGCGARLVEVIELLSQNAEEIAMSTEEEKHSAAAIFDALLVLDVRERYVVDRRLMAHREEQLSLAEIGRRFSVSRERARQIEARAIRKLKAALIGSAPGAEWLPYRGAA